jgi:hypothetical protein
VLWRIVAIEHPNAAFAPCYYVTAATPSTVAQFEPTVGVVVLYPSQLFGVQFAVAPSHGKIIDRREQFAISPLTNPQSSLSCC